MLGNFFSWLSNPEKVAEFIADTTVCLLIFISIILIGKVLKLIMDSLKGFFKGNAKQVENEKVVISDRFVGEDGKPLEWEIRAIGNETDDELRNQCTSQVKIKKNVYMPKLDYTEYLKKLLVACVVYPNLNNKELQDSYTVMTAEELLSAMLLPGEYNALAEKVQEICGFDKDIMEEKIEEAKN